MVTDGSVFNRKLITLERWHAREPLSARKLNAPVDAINSMRRGLTPTQQISSVAIPEAAAVGESSWFVYDGEWGDDWFSAKLIDWDAAPGNNITSTRVLIALPWDLRRSSWEDDIVTIRGGRFRYAHYGPQQRISTYLDDDPDIPSTEYQMINPPYSQSYFLDNDVRITGLNSLVRAVKTEKLGRIHDFGALESRKVEWLDIGQTVGRAWSEVPE